MYMYFSINQIRKQVLVGMVMRLLFMINYHKYCMHMKLLGALFDGLLQMECAIDSSFSISLYYMLFV